MSIKKIIDLLSLFSVLIVWSVLTQIGTCFSENVEFEFSKASNAFALDLYAVISKMLNILYELAKGKKNFT